MAIRTLAPLVVCAGCGGAATSLPPSNAGGAPARPVPADVAGMRALLEPYAAMKFDAGAIDRGCPAEQSLGAYVEMLVRVDPEAAPGDTFRLTGGCGAFPERPIPIDPPADEAHAFCRIDSYRVDAAGESPWHYELHVRVRRADLAVDLATVACPGA